MSRKSLFALALFASILFALGTGCSDDSGTKPDTGGTTADSGGTTVDSAASTGDGGSSGSGKCVNSADTPLLDTKAKRSEVSKKVGACGLQCIAATDQKKCATDCIIKDTKLSTDCSGCYADNVLCSAKNCLHRVRERPIGRAVRQVPR